MQRRVLLGAGGVVLALAAVIVFKSATQHVAGRALDQAIDQMIAALPPGYTATHGETGANPLTGTVTVHNIAVRRGNVVNWSVDLLSLSGVDQEALRAVFDPTAYKNGRPAWTGRRLLVTDASASGVHIFAPNGTAVIKSITLHRLSGRPFIRPPTPDNAKDQAFRADAALAFAVQSLDQSDLAFSTNTKEAKSLAIGAISLHDYDGGMIGAASVRDLALHGGRSHPGDPSVQLTLDRAEIRKLDMVAQLESLRQRGPDDKPALTGLTSYGDFTLAGLNIDVSPGPHLSLADVHGTFPPPEPDGARLGDGEFRGLTLALNDMAVPQATRSILAAFGMNSLTIDIAAQSRTTTNPPHSLVNEQVVLHDLGTLKLAIGFSGYDQAAFRHDPKAVVMATPIEKASLEWDDAGLLNRALAAAAVQMHTTPDVIRGQMAMPLVTLGLLMPDQPDATDQVTAFLNHPHTLLVTIDPPQKVTLAEVAKAPAETRAHLLGARILAK